MATVDTETVLNRARLALDASDVGSAILEGDIDEARFRAHLMRAQALELGLDDVAHAALLVIVLLPPTARLPCRGIGRALLRLCNSLAVH